MTRQSFIKGTMILLAAGVVNRILGFIPRIALPRIIGAEGIGLYQMAYPLMIVLLTIISGGVPLAVAKLVAEAQADGKMNKITFILRVALAFTLSLSLVFIAMCIWLADWISSRWFTDERVIYSFVAMTPVLMLAGVSSVYRGYFQGLHNMIPTALSQLTETIIRIIAVLLFAYLLLPQGIHLAAAGAMLGVVAGELCGLLVLLLQYRLNKMKHAKEESIPKSRTVKQLFGIAIPVTGSRLVGSGSYFLESILIVQNLAIAGVATVAATTQYGILQGMVMPILLLPTALTYSLAVSLIPSLSEAAQKNDHRTVRLRMYQSIRLALVTGAPFAVIMYVLAEPLCLFVFNNKEAGTMLRMMAPIALFIYFQGPLQAALQALDRPGTALRNTLIGAVMKLLLIGLLASKPSLGILGAIIAINVNIVLVTMLHWNSVNRFLKLTMPFIDFMKVGIAMAMTGFTSYVLWTRLPLGSHLRLSAVMLAALIIYLLCCIWLKLIDRDDFKRMQWLSKKIVK